MTSKLRVGVIFGGRSSEHEVSVVSARHIIEACDVDRFDVVPIGVSRTGAWLSLDASAEVMAAVRKGALQSIESEKPGLLSAPQALAALREIDVAFPIIHGTNGEDGTLQGLLELVDLPYVGAGVAASAIGMDKVFQKQIWSNAGLPVVDYRVVHESEWRHASRDLLRSLSTEMNFPVFVKPANAGSSVGVSKAHSVEDLPEAIEYAFKHDRKVLVEQAIAGREIECAVMGNEEPEAAPPGEVVPDREFYDYEAKYSPESKSQFIVPADIPVSTAEAIKKIAIMAYKSIDCAGMGRVDFFLAGGEAVLINEINTLPGFTPISGYPKMWQAAGLSYSDLITRLLELALERHAEKQARAERKGPAS